MPIRIIGARQALKFIHALVVREMPIELGRIRSAEGLSTTYLPEFEHIKRAKIYKFPSKNALEIYNSRTSVDENAEIGSDGVSGHLFTFRVSIKSLEDPEDLEYILDCYISAIRQIIRNNQSFSIDFGLGDGLENAGGIGFSGWHFLDARLGTRYSTGLMGRALVTCRVEQDEELEV